jgi:hypothetical protein
MSFAPKRNKILDAPQKVETWEMPIVNPDI